MDNYQLFIVNYQLIGDRFLSVSVRGDRFFLFCKVRGDRGLGEVW
jgi:hypothetical protein